jgi:hypothetical protein
VAVPSEPPPGASRTGGDSLDVALSGGLYAQAAGPSNAALPKSKIPPSAATKRYPSPPGMAAIPTHDWVRRTLPVDPKKGAPKEKMPPSDASSH